MNDFVQQNSAFLLSLCAMLGVCCAGVGACILKSRCSHIKCCGFEISRDVLPAEQMSAPVHFAPLGEN